MTDSTKKAYSAPVLHILPTDDTMGKTIAKGGEGFYSTNGAQTKRSNVGNGGGTNSASNLGGYDGGADSKVNYDES